MSTLAINKGRPSPPLAQLRNSRPAKRTRAKTNTRAKNRPNVRLASEGRARRNPGGLGRTLRRTMLWLTVLGLLGLLAAGLYAAYSTVTSHPYFDLDNVQVTGLDRLTRDELLSSAGLDNDVNLLGLNLAKAEAALAANPWVAQVSVRRELPDQLFITVREKQPVYWVATGQAMAYADIQGRPIAPVTGERFTPLPQAVVEPGADRFRPLLERVSGLLDAGDLPFVPGEVAWVRLTAGGRVEMLADGRGLLVSLPAENFDTGLARLDAVLGDLRTRGEMARVSAITVRTDRVWVEYRAGRSGQGPQGVESCPRMNLSSGWTSGPRRSAPWSASPPAPAWTSSASAPLRPPGCGAAWW